MPTIIRTLVLSSLLFHGPIDPPNIPTQEEETEPATQICLPADMEIVVGDPCRVRDMRFRFDRMERGLSTLEKGFRPDRKGHTTDTARQVSMTRRNPARHGIDPPTTEGLCGFGIWFDSYSLLWSEITATLQEMIVPRTPGGDVYTDLYLVTTNRSNFGTEAYIAYHAQEDFNFVIWDWGRWFLEMDTLQTVIPYEDLSDYIHDACNPDRVYRQIIKVINITERTDFNDWNNRVYLYNRKAGMWDLVYFHSYTTFYPNQNLYNPGDPYGSWGPTFETFQDHDGSNKPIGFHDCWLYQDGELFWLTPENSWVDVQDPSLDPPIYLLPNASWAVGITNGEPTDQVFEAEAGIHEIGRPYPPARSGTHGGNRSGSDLLDFPLGFGWIAAPADGKGWLLRGPFWMLPPGRLNAEFQMAIADVEGPNDPICRIGVWDETAESYTVEETIYRNDFAGSFRTELFRYDFEAMAGHSYEFVVYSLAGETFGIDRVIIVKN